VSRLKPEGAGAAGGLQPQWIISELNGTPLVDQGAYKRALRDTRPGDWLAFKGFDGHQDKVGVLPVGAKNLTMEQVFAIRRLAESSAQDLAIDF